MKAHRLLYHSTLGSRVIKKKKKMQEASHQPSQQHQIALFPSLICTGARRNLATCGTHQVSRKRRFASTLRAGGQVASAVDRSVCDTLCTFLDETFVLFDSSRAFLVPPYIYTYISLSLCLYSSISLCLFISISTPVHLCIYRERESIFATNMGRERPFLTPRCVRYFVLTQQHCSVQRDRERGRRRERGRERERERATMFDSK